MTQFASLYSLAQDTGLPLAIPSIDGFPLTTMGFHTSEVDEDIIDRATTMPWRHYIGRHWIRNLSGPVIVQRYSYLENIYNFHHHKRAISSIFQMPAAAVVGYTFFKGPRCRLRTTNINSIRSNDLMISLRIGDFVNKPDADDDWRKRVYSRFLGYSYFRIILEQITFDRLFITSDEPFHALTADFDQFDPIRVQNDHPIKTMNLVRGFRRIAIPESTFSWWASYLSEADEIYYPISTNGLWGINEAWDKSSASWKALNPLNVRDSDLYLRVDEDRYRYVHQPSGTIYRYRDAPGKRSLDEFEHLLPSYSGVKDDQ